MGNRFVGFIIALFAYLVVGSVVLVLCQIFDANGVNSDWKGREYVGIILLWPLVILEAIIYSVTWIIEALSAGYRSISEV